MSKDDGFPLPSPVTGYPLICVTLKIPDNDQYRRDFLGHIWQLGKWWMWEQSGEPGDTRARDAAQYWRGLLADHLVMGECPVDCCDDILEAIAALQLQVDNQGKQNLTRNVQQQQVESQGLRDVYEDKYDGSPTSINPDAPTVNFGSSGDRLDALCAALMAYIYQAANAQVQALVAGDVAAFALLAAAAILLIPGLNLFYLAGASLALLAGGGIIGVSTGTAIEALTDTSALDNVVCYMRDQLKSLSVTQANFAAVLNTYPWSPGSHESIVADFLKAQLGTNYLAMLDMLGQAYSGAINGQPLPSCPCVVEDCLDFTSSDQDVAAYGGAGQWIDGAGWAQEVGGGVALIFNLSDAPNEIHSFRIEFSRAWAGATPNPDYDKFLGQVSSATGTAPAAYWGFGADPLRTGSEITINAAPGTYWDKGDMIISNWSGGFSWPQVAPQSTGPQYIASICFNV